MANLPPRPETPPKLREERRHPQDDRERDRRAAQPMAPSRISRPLPERERTYVPSRRPDTYIPGGYDNRRESDRRDHSRDRERDRYRDIGRDRDRDRRVGRDRERDYDRSPRKWELSDRDRRPYDRDRGTYRKPLSPIRRSGSGPSRRDSRSPPRRRLPRSPSPSYRSRARSRTRTRSPRRSPLPSKSIRLGNHSIGTSPRSRSPRRRSRSRDTSMNVDKRLSMSAAAPSSNQQPSNTQAPLLIPEIKKEEDVEIRLPEEGSPVKPEEKPAHLTPQDLKSSRELPEVSLSEEIKPPIHELAQTEQNLRTEEKTPSIKPKVEGIKTEKHEVTIPTSPAGSKRALKVETAEEITANKMDIVDSPKKIPIISNLPARSPSPQAPRSAGDHQRLPVPTVPPRSWSGRSPPRGPRNFARPMGTPQNQPPYAIGRRDSRRPYPIQGQSTFPPSVPIKADSDMKLPMIPKYDRSKAQTELTALEGELAKLRTLRLTHAHQDLTQVKGLQRALHELEMASIDLHAAEGRRRVADAQLEKAKTGSLGIDAPDIVDVKSIIPS